MSFGFDRARVQLCYFKGSLNENADVLSRREVKQWTAHVSTAAATAVCVRHVLFSISSAARQSREGGLRSSAFIHTRTMAYKQWTEKPFHSSLLTRSQLQLNRVVCRCHTPGLAPCVLTGPVLAFCQRVKFCKVIVMHHVPLHLGTEKTLAQVRQEAYWVSMATDVEYYCCECPKSPAVKPASATHSLV